MNQRTVDFTDPTNFSKCAEELRQVVTTDIEDLQQAGVNPAVIISAYLTGIWRFMIAYYGGTIQACIQLSNITGQLQTIGPRIEAEVRGSTIH